MLCTSDDDNSMLYMLGGDTWQQCQYATHVKWWHLACYVRWWHLAWYTYQVVTLSSMLHKSDGDNWHGVYVRW